MSAYLHRFAGVALGLVLAALSPVAFADPILTPVNTSGEPSLSGIIAEIEASDGITLDRVSDDQDEFWTLAGDGTVVPRARYAGYNNTFGVIDGTDGGTFVALVSSLNGNGLASQGGAVTYLPYIAGDFRLAIETPYGEIWSSSAGDNIDFMDHMVTWVDAHDPHNYVVAFEDLALPGGDGDYNDIVLELRNVLDGPQAAVPEPGSLLLTGLGLAALGWFRRSQGGAVRRGNR